MQSLLPLFSHPSHYSGIEEGSVHKPYVRLRCALAFPDLYELGMSYLGQKILYSILNAREDCAAERVFAPSVDVGELLHKHKMPLATLETDTPLAQCDLLGFAVTHELCFTNILYMLDLAGIPLRAAARGDDLAAFPLVVAGGGCAISAEPIAPFMDLMLLGDGEEMLPELCDLLLQAKEAGWTKSAFICKAVHIAGIYAPSLYREQTNGQLVPILPKIPCPGRRIVADLDSAVYPVRQVVPFGAVHNRLSLEIARGCTRGCRFCQAGMLYRPARERNLQNIEQILDRCLTETGFDDVSFLSLSTGDFSALKTLFLDTADHCAQEQIALSLPSLRVGSVDDAIMAKMACIRRTGATLAPEAGSQRLRDSINKGITEEELLAHIRALAAHGWQQVKLYFMIGLPGETQEDLQAIFDLCRKAGEAAGRPRLQVTASISPFVPKPFTPFQWERQLSLEEMRERIHFLRDLFHSAKGLTLRWHDPEVSFLEGILSRGDRRLADVIESAYRKGALFASWMDFFRLAPWLEALAEFGIDPETYTGSRKIFLDADGTIPAPLPWDHLESGISREFLLRERNKSLAGTTTEDCRYATCQNCGACDRKRQSLLPATGIPHRNRLNFSERDQNKPDLHAEYARREKPSVPAMNPELAVRAVRYRIWHRKTGKSVWISQLELQTLLYRAMRRANLQLAFSQGFHPLPLLSFGRALPVGVQSLAEYFSITLRKKREAQQVLNSLAPFMLQGMEIQKIQQIPLYEKFSGALEEIFLVSCRNQERKADFIRSWTDFAAAETFPFLKKNKTKTKEIDLRIFARDIEDIGSGQIRFCADWSEQYISPLTLVRAITPWLGLQDLQIIKTEQKF